MFILHSRETLATPPTVPLGSPRALVAFHQHRARAYAVVGELTAEAPTPERLRSLRDRWTRGGHARATAETDDLLDILEPGAAKQWSKELRAWLHDRNAQVSLVCKDAAAQARHDAAALVALPLDGTRPREALLLANLAGITARYLGDGRILEAASATDVQVKLLGVHAGDCLGELGRALTDLGDAPRYSRVGRYLLATLAEDHRLLVAHGSSQGLR